MTEQLAYVLITPARNEAAYIEKTLQSMAAQTVPPLRWVIVSDGSTDGTDDIVKRYTDIYPWMELLRMPERTERHFAGKVHAFNAGLARVQDLDYQVIGNLDADTSFEGDLFAFLLEKFAENPRLGVAGTAYLERGRLAYDYGVFNLEDVDGQVQVFRRACFEEVGGYVPIKNGGIDMVPVYLARMKGWKTWTFTEKTYVHHRVSGTGESNILASFYRSGKKDYYLGSHPAWMALRCLYQMKNRPKVLSGLLLFAGYASEFLKRAEYPIPQEMVVFRHKEQMQRLKEMVRRRLHLGGKGTGSEPALTACGKEITLYGRFPRIARLKDEYYEWIDKPEGVVAILKAAGAGADLFTFVQRLQDRSPGYRFHCELESMAMLPLSTHDHWWTKQINDKTRNMVRKAKKSGVEVRVVEFSDDLVRGIKGIYDETPLRQGKPFTHYGKDLETLREIHGSFPDRSEFIGAFLGEELIGFIKLVHDDGVSHLVHILSKVSERDKAPTNALVDMAVQICTSRGIPYLHYADWSRRGLGDFKKHHAFEQFEVPRYFVPLNWRGELFLRLNFHRRLLDVLPESWVDHLVNLRSRWNQLRYNARKA